MENVLSKVQSFCEFNETVELESDLKKFVYGQSIVAIVPINSKYLQLILDNGIIINVESNEGCAGCYNGWWEYDSIITEGIEGNIITKVEVISKSNEKDENCISGTFSINIYSRDKRILSGEFNGCDDGFYGVGITIQCCSIDNIDKVRND